jgi:hypothetical protein
VTAPRHVPPGGGKGPFGERAFWVTLALCVVLVGLGIVLLAVTTGPVAHVGTAIIVLGSLGLLTSALGLLVELVQRGRRR